VSDIGGTHDVPGYGVITIRLLDSGYWHARGIGPCSWAQWPVNSAPEFFPGAGDRFRRALSGIVDAGLAPQEEP